MISPTCDRCGRTLAVGDRVVDVRKVTRASHGSISTDRGDAVAHVTCPTEATPMSYNEARDAILAILDRVPTHALPEGRIEHHNGETILWFGGHGRHLGSARRGNERDPSIYHRDAAEVALELEATYRADLAHEPTDQDHTNGSGR